MTAPARRHHLTPAERAILVGLFAEMPGAYCPAIAAAFLARTGRAVTRANVLRIRRDGYSVPRQGRSSAHLAPDQVALLHAMLREADPAETIASIARRFAGRTGRPINLPTAYRHARLLGVARPVGCPPRRWVAPC